MALGRRLDLPGEIEPNPTPVRGACTTTAKRSDDGVLAGLAQQQGLERFREPMGIFLIRISIDLGQQAKHFGACRLPEDIRYLLDGELIPQWATAEDGLRKYTEIGASSLMQCAIEFAHFWFGLRAGPHNGHEWRNTFQNVSEVVGP